MFTPGTKIFIRVSDASNQRILYPAQIKDVDDDLLSAQLFSGDEINDTSLPVNHLEDFTVEAGQDILVYFDDHHKFMQQPARIETAVQRVNETIIAFRTLGTPVSAERRQSFRVSTLMAELTAQIDNEECPLVDVSATGFSVISTRRYDIGTIVPVSLHFEDTTYSGKASIQSIRDLDQDRIRYGLHGIEVKNTKESLTKGLSQINMQVQRKQLRRMAANT